MLLISVAFVPGDRGSEPRVPSGSEKRYSASHYLLTPEILMAQLLHVEWHSNHSPDSATSTYFWFDVSKDLGPLVSIFI